MDKNHCQYHTLYQNIINSFFVYYLSYNINFNRLAWKHVLFSKKRGTLFSTNCFTNCLGSSCTCKYKKSMKNERYIYVLPSLKRSTILVFRAFTYRSQCVKFEFTWALRSAPFALTKRSPCVYKSFNLCSSFFQHLLIVQLDNIIFRLITYIHIVYLLFFFLITNKIQCKDNSE